MKKELTKAIEATAVAATKAAASTSESSDTIMKLTQAALNLAQALSIIEHLDHPPEK